jgi:hypothetical protein
MAMLSCIAFEVMISPCGNGDSLVMLETAVGGRTRKFALHFGIQLFAIFMPGRTRCFGPEEFWSGLGWIGNSPCRVAGVRSRLENPYLGG